jgi:hypothetical protein
MGWLSPLGSAAVVRRGSIVFDSGSVAAGAAIDTGVLDLTGIEDLFIVVTNAATGLAPNITMDSGHVLRAVAVGAVVERGTVGVHASGAVGTAPALNFSRGGPLPTKAQFHLVANGAAAARVTIYGR